MLYLLGIRFDPGFSVFDALRGANKNCLWSKVDIVTYLFGGWSIIYNEVGLKLGISNVSHLADTFNAFC